VFSHDKQLWMRSFYQGAAQFDWRIGGGGALSELRDAQAGYERLLAESPHNMTDRIIQWVLWGKDIQLDPADRNTRMDVNQAGNYENVFAPVMTVSSSTAAGHCLVTVRSNPKNQWFNRHDARLHANLSAITNYDFGGGVLTINRYVLVNRLMKDGRDILASNIYFEGWSTFRGYESYSPRGFDRLVLRFNNAGTPVHWYRHNQNVPAYPKTPLSATAGYATVINPALGTGYPSMSLIFGTAADTPGIKRMLNFMDFTSGIGILPAVEGDRVPVGSMITQQLKVYMTRGVYPLLDAQLRNLSDSIAPAQIYGPAAALSPDLEAVRQSLKRLPTETGVRTENLGR
jgi:hypothetical protein